MTAPGPLVTVVIPTRNRWPLLQRTLGSVLAQQEAPFEVVIVDDGSAATAPRALLAGRRDAPVRLIRHDVARGVAQARNRGADEARGEWVAFLDDDDLWAPEKLAVQLGALADARSAFGYAGALRVSAALEVFSEMRPPGANVLRHLLLERSAIPAGASNVIISTELFRDLGGFDEEFSQLADWDLWLRLAAASRPAVADALLIAYVQHPANMLATERGSIVDEFRGLERKHAHLEQELGSGLHGAGLALWAAERHWQARQWRRAFTALAHGAIRWPDRRMIPGALRLPARDLQRMIWPQRNQPRALPGPAWLESLR